MIIFTNSQKQSIRSIFYFLECYEWVSSHLVNRDKSGLKLPRWASDIQIRRLVFLTEFMSSGHSLIYGFLYLKGPRRACSIMTSFNRLGAESQVGLYDYFHTKDELLCWGLYYPLYHFLFFRLYSLPMLDWRIREQFFCNSYGKLRIERFTYIGGIGMSVF